MANAIAAAPSVGVVTGPDCGTKYDCNGSGGTAYAAGAIKTASTAIALPNAASFTITPPPSWGTQNRVSHRPLLIFADQPTRVGNDEIWPRIAVHVADQYEARAAGDAIVDH